LSNIIFRKGERMTQDTIDLEQRIRSAAILKCKDDTTYKLHLERWGPEHADAMAERSAGWVVLRYSFCSERKKTQFVDNYGLGDYMDG